jgi:hypothetical protein
VRQDDRHVKEVLIAIGPIVGWGGKWRAGADDHV